MRPSAASAAFAIGLSTALAAAPVLAEPASPWIRDGSSALRLVDAGRGAEPGTRLAAIAIELDPGWKTYWRQPGASGVPPRFDFSRSVNVAEARVAYPAPERSDDGDGVTNVYHGRVVLPVIVRPRDPAEPVDLRLVADFGVCEAVCVPVRAEADLDLEAGSPGRGPAADEVREALERVPKPLGLGQGGPLSLLSVRRAGGTLEIVATAPANGPAPLLFAETGDGDYAPAPEQMGAPSAGCAAFRVTFDEPEFPSGRIRLTLAAGDRAIETEIALDAVIAAP